LNSLIIPNSHYYIISDDLGWVKDYIKKSVHATYLEHSLIDNEEMIWMKKMHTSYCYQSQCQLVKSLVGNGELEKGC
jgi:hypothetical protein